MILSFIVPAHNEEACLAATLDSIHHSARTIDLPYEVIVVDDASTDRTGAIGHQSGAIIVTVNHRQIAATRNSGASSAKGDYLFFVDADTIINPKVLAAALRHFEKGAVGGGSVARFDKGAPLYMRLLVWYLGLFMRLVGICGGAFLFCTGPAFRASGGFDERLFGAEDAAFSWALQRQGRFAVLWPRVLTSSRRVRGPKGLLMLGTLIGIAFFPRMLRQRSRVKKIWYESDRHVPERSGQSLLFQFFNLLMLAVSALWITGPIWNLIPRELTPVETGLGKFRLTFDVISCHIGLALWPCSFHLGRNLLRQHRWTDWIKTSVLIAISITLAWGATKVVVWFWQSVFGLVPD